MRDMEWMDRLCAEHRDRKSTRLNSSHSSISYSFFFFFNDTATTEIYPLSLHDALPILRWALVMRMRRRHERHGMDGSALRRASRSEEHTSELQSQFHLVFLLFFF